MAEHGSMAGAAKALRRHHPNVIQAMKSLEERTGLVILDRTSYRTHLTPAGERFLAAAQGVLQAELALQRVAEALHQDWEPAVSLVYDGLLPHQPLLNLALDVQQSAPMTGVSMHAAFLTGVQQTFVDLQATVLITLLPEQMAEIQFEPLSPLTSLLVVHRQHPLARIKGRVTLADMEEHTFLTVHGSDPRLAMSTAPLKPRAMFSLADFHAKKAALMAGMGYGWMPQHLIRNELKRRQLRLVQWERSSEHVFFPSLGVRRQGRVGPASMELCRRIRALSEW